MIKRIIVICAVSFLVPFFICAQNRSRMSLVKTEEVSASESDRDITASRIQEIKSELSKIYIQTDVSGVKIYLNGVYQGVSNLTISDHKEGYYSLKLVKDGYRTERLRIRVKGGRTQNFYVEMHKWTGWVDIKTEPAGALVSVDGSTMQKNYFELAEGEHRISVSMFGYETLTEEIYIHRNTVQYLDVQLESAAFRISSLEAGKKAMNPYLSSSAGRVDFSFYVSNHGTGQLDITAPEGNVVRTFIFNDFSTWNQKVTWDGCDMNGYVLPDGEYTAVLSCENQILNVPVIIDSSITYAAAFPDFKGLSIGSVGTAMIHPEDTFALFFRSGCDITNKTDSFYGVPLSFGFDYAVSSFADFCLWGDFLIKEGDQPFTYGAALKFAGKKRLEKCNFDYAFVIRGGGNECDFYEPCGSDNGRGFGGGFNLGLENSLIYAGISSEFIYNVCFDDDVYDTDYIWKNGAALALKGSAGSAGIYFSMTSAFGDSSYWTRCLEGGLDLNVQLGRSPLFCNLSSGILYYTETDGKFYLKNRLGFVWLF